MKLYIIRDETKTKGKTTQKSLFLRLMASSSASSLCGSVYEVWGKIFNKRKMFTREGAFGFVKFLIVLAAIIPSVIFQGKGLDK